MPKQKAQQKEQEEVKPNEQPPVQEQPKQEQPEQKEQPQTPPPSDEELNAEREQIMSKFFPGYKPDKKEDKEPAKEEKQDEKQEQEKAAEAETEVKEEKKQKPQKKQKQDLPPPLDETILKEVPETKSKEEAPPQKKVEEPAQLDEDSQIALEACELLASTNPKYKKLAEQTRKFWEAEEEYKSKWEKEHKGTPFNPNDDEHSDFYTENQPDVPEADFERAKARVIARREIRAELDPIKKEVIERDKNREASQKMSQAAPKVNAVMMEALTTLFEDATDGAFKDFIKRNEHGMVESVDTESMRKTNPGAVEILMEHSKKLSHVSRELARLVYIGADYKPNVNATVDMGDGVMFMPFREIVSISDQLESEMSKLPPEDTVRDGKRFVTHDQASAAWQKIHESSLSPEQKRALVDKFASKYYTISHEDVLAAAVAKHVDLAKKRIKSLSPFQAKKNVAAETPQQGDGNQSKSKPQEKRSTAPSVAAASDIVDAANGGGGVGSIDPKQFEKKMGWD